MTRHQLLSMIVERLPGSVQRKLHNMRLARARPKSRYLKAETDLERCVTFLQLQGTESYHQQLKPFPLRILYVGSRYDYADPSRGLADHEAQTLHCLLHCGHQVIRFDFEELALKMGVEIMNELLVEAVMRYRPHISLFMLHRPGINPETVKELSASGRTITFGVFSDDIRRFDNFSCKYTLAFDWVGTDWESVVDRCRELGQRQALFKPYACNHFFDAPLGLPQEYDVTFIGIPYGRRKNALQQLKNDGIPVQTWGYGSPNGRLSQTKMVRLFNQSKINLDLYGRLSDEEKDELRARPFEVCGCGAFLITFANGTIGKFYNVGEEIVCYRDEEELSWLVRYYLDHEEERATIAERAYQRTLQDHTLERQLFRDFQTILGC